MVKFSICFIVPFLCLNLGNAQFATPSGTSTPVVAPPNPSASPTANALPGVLGSINASPGKYDEYQSICRFNEYDLPSFEEPQEQQKKIDALNDRIKSTLINPRLKIRLLKEYIDQGKNSEAEKFYQKFKEEKISDVDGKMADAIFALVRKDYKRAESLLASIVLDDGKNKDALEYLAEIYKTDGNYFESAAAYYDLAKLTKENYDLQLCEVLTLDSQHSESDKVCKKAAQKYSTNPYPLIYLAISQREKLNYSDAIQRLKDSLWRKQTEMGFTCLAEIFYIKENYANAVELFNRASKISPNSARAIHGLAWAQFKDKKMTESLETFKLACKKDRRVKAEIRKAFKILTDQKSNMAKQFADLAQNCSD